VTRYIGQKVETARLHNPCVWHEGRAGRARRLDQTFALNACLAMWVFHSAVFLLFQDLYGLISFLLASFTLYLYTYIFDVQLEALNGFIPINT
jgi:hypothetical protein